MAWRDKLTLSGLSLSARKAVAGICGAELSDDEEMNYTRQKLMLGEEEDLPHPEVTVPRAPYISPTLVAPPGSLDEPSGSISSVAPAAATRLVTPERSELDKAIDQAKEAAQAKLLAAQAEKERSRAEKDKAAACDSEPQSSQLVQQQPEPAVGGRPAEPVAEPVKSEDVNAHPDPVPEACREEGSIEDLMAAVARLEEQGKLVEASTLMARGMRKR
jgi:hypothetical protein